MATGKGENIDKFCKDPLLQRELKKRYQTFLTEVKVPTRWKETVKDRSGYKLQESHETYSYREELLRAFKDKKKSENFELTDKTIKQFFRELEDFSYSEETEKHDKSKSRATSTVYDLFDQDDFKVQGVVVRKTNQKAWILVKKVCKSSGRREISEDIELLLDLKTFGADDFSTAFLKVGDILEVTTCKRGTETALEPDIIWYVN